MTITYDLVDLIKNSGFIIPRKILGHLLMNRNLPRYLPMLKINPAHLEYLSPRQFSLAISKINIGGTFKTVRSNRNKRADKEILTILKDRVSINYAEVGCSDGSATIDIYMKYRDQFQSFDLYDFYTKFLTAGPWFFRPYTNETRRIVYFQFFMFLIYVYPFNVKSNKRKKQIYFDNPILEQSGLKVHRADIFRSAPPKEYDLIKCSNVLNPCYFTMQEIIKGIKNLKQWLKKEGYLIISHNNTMYEDEESVVVFHKKGKTLQKMKVIGQDFLGQNVEGEL